MTRCGPPAGTRTSRHPVSCCRALRIASSSAAHASQRATWAATDSRSWEASSGSSKRGSRWETLLQLMVIAPLQTFGEHAARPGESGADRADGTLQHRGDLVVTQVLHLPQDEHAAKLERQTFQRPAQPQALLGREGGFLRSGTFVFRLLDRLSLGTVAPALEQGTPLPAAELVEADVVGDAIYPGGKG